MKTKNPGCDNISNSMKDTIIKTCKLNTFTSVWWLHAISLLWHAFGDISIAYCNFFELRARKIRFLKFTKCFQIFSFSSSESYFLKYKKVPFPEIWGILLFLYYFLGWWGQGVEGFVSWNIKHFQILEPESFIFRKIRKYYNFF